MSDLLKESIADAKAVRETAIANAKAFLEENFSRQIEQMFAKKLEEETAAEGDQGSAEPEGSSSDIGTSNIGGEHGNVPEKQKPVNPSTDASKTTTDTSGEGPEVVKESEVQEVDDTTVTSEELDEILAELEGETTEAKSNPHSEKPEGKTPEPDASEKPSTEEAAVCEDNDSDVSEEINLDELLAELELSEKNEKPSDETSEAAYSEGKSEDGDAEGEVTAEEMAEALVAINEENESLRAKLTEHENTVKYLKGVLEETNLLNAKLLYTNKLFKGKNLTEEQKLKVINTFDLTKSIREIKLAYTVLAESFNAGGSVAKKKTNATVTTITEGLASKPVSSTKPDSTIVEPQADEMANRFQKLAGIKR